MSAGKVYDLTARRRLIQDNAQPLPDGHKSQVQNVEKLQ